MSLHTCTFYFRWRGQFCLKASKLSENSLLACRRHSIDTNGSLAISLPLTPSFSLSFFSLSFSLSSLLIHASIYLHKALGKIKEETRRCSRFFRYSSLSHSDLLRLTPVKCSFKMSFLEAQHELHPDLESLVSFDWFGCREFTCEADKNSIRLCVTSFLNIFPDNLFAQRWSISLVE